MKHVKEYYEYITEGKKQVQFILKTDKKFNLFDLLNALKPLGGEVLDGQPKPDAKDELIVTVAMDESKRKRIEEEIAKYAKLLK
jgi:hypothetical protein